MIDNYVMRRQLEQSEKWHDIVGKMPKLKFYFDWEITIIPPFAGAVARFIVNKDNARVSVYCDWYERLGSFGEPHWEIYPDANDDNATFSLNDTDELMRAIADSLEKQKVTAS